MKSIIIDDEVQSHIVLKNALTGHHPEVEVLGTAFGVKEGIQLIEKIGPDLIFLDIDMPDGTGFDLLNLMPTIYFQVIFVTGFNQFAQTAIRFGALDYLIKPVESHELSLALEKAKEKVEEKSWVAQLEIMNQTIQNLKQEKLPGKIGIASVDGILFFDTDKIIVLKAMQNFTEFIVEGANKRLIAYHGIGKYELDLTPYPIFMRIHRSYIVNLLKFKRLQKGDRWYVEMINQEVLPVSRKYRDELIDRLKKLGFIF